MSSIIDEIKTVTVPGIKSVTKQASLFLGFYSVMS